MQKVVGSNPISRLKRGSLPGPANPLGDGMTTIAIMLGAMIVVDA